MPNIRWLLAAITNTHRWIYLKSGGRLGGGVLGLRFLLLYHVGRKSGREFSAPLLYVEHQGGWAVAGSNAGDERAPAWWLNLQAHSRARIRVDHREVDVVARKLEGAEAELVWKKLVGSYRWYTDYRERTSREIPVVLLEKAGAA